MKKILAIAFIAIMGFTGASTASAKTKVGGYTTKRGTYVAPHYRTDRNGYKSDNWSYHGNTNPYTGKKGYKW